MPADACLRDEQDETRDTERKALLVCPECDHRSPPDGDWYEEADDSRLRRICPVCEAIVEHRPTFERSERDD